MKFFAFPVFLVAAGNIWGQAGADFTALGRNAANPDAALSLANNPAFFEKETLSIAVWGQNRFTGTNLIHGGLAMHKLQKNTAFGLSADYHGTPLYNQSRVYLNAGQHITENFSCGISIGYSKLFQAYDYVGIRGRICGKVAAHFRFAKKADAAFVIANPWILSDDWKVAPPRADLAIGYAVGKQTRICAQYRQEQDLPAVFGLSITQHLRNKFSLRAAFQNGNEPISFGFSWMQKTFSLSLASVYHSYLGLTPAFTLKWQKS